MMRHNRERYGTFNAGATAWRSAMAITAMVIGTAMSAQTCDPVDVPYIQDFNSVTTPALPECMTGEVIFGQMWITVSAPNGMTGKSANVTYTPAGSPDQNTWMFTRGLNLNGGTSYRLTYKYYNNSTAFQENLAVSIGTAASSAAMTTQLVDHVGIMTTTVRIDTLEYTPTANGVYYIGFQCHSIADQNQLYLDDIMVDATPSCEMPTALASSSITTTGADLSWAASASQPTGGYQWELRTAGAGGSGTTGLVTSGNTTAGVTDASSGLLDPNTIYFLYVRSDCGNGDFSLWAGPITFVTACVATNIPYSENFNAVTVPALPNCMTIDTISGRPWTSITAPAGMTGNVASVTYTPTGSPDQDSWLFTQALNLSAGTSYRLTYKYFNNTTIWTERMAVKYGTSNDGAAMTFPLAKDTAINTTTVQIDTVEFTPAASGVYYIGFQCYSIANQNRLYLDDIRVIVTPTCEEPTLLAVSNSTSTGADLSWMASMSAPAGGYQWEIRTTGDAGSGSIGLVDEGSTIAGVTTATTDQLDPDSEYFLYVRSDCGSGDQSLWAGPFSFSTLCVSTDVPYMEDFDSVTVPELPNCMSNEAVSGNPWKTVAAPAGMTGNAAVVSYTPSGSPDMNTWLYTQGLNLVAGTTYRLTYEYFNNSTFFTENMAVYFGGSADATSMTNLLADHPGIATTTVQDGLSTFTVANSGVYYVGFKCYSTANQFFLYVDNIEVVALQDCTVLPTPGLTTGPSTICPGVPFTLGIENGTTDGGITYQWEMSMDGVTWTAAGGADSLDTYTTSLTGNTWFRVQVTCVSAGTAISTPLDITVNAPGDCYCASAFTDVSFEYITNVSYAGINNTSVGITGGPVNYTDQVAQVTQGGSDTLSVTLLAAGGDYLYAFIDWNHNGILNDTGEVYSLAQNTSLNGPHTQLIQVPMDAAEGTTRMRVMVAYNGTVPDPCTVAQWGEAEDYSVEVALGTDCAGVLGGPDMPGTPCISTDNFGGIWSTDCVCVENVGIGEIAAKNGIAVHPNPATTELYLTTPDSKPVHVKVYDMVGHLAMERDMVTRLDITELAPGSYSLLIIGEKGMTTGHARFMKL